METNTVTVTETERKYGGLDIFRIVAAFLIVGIHTYPLTSINSDLNYALVNILSRIAVPFFLMLTGYFVVSKMFDENSEVKYPVRFVKKTGFIYLLASVIYIPISIYAGAYNQDNPVVAVVIIKNIFLDGTFYHLWYLPASIIGVSLIYALRKRFTLSAILGIAVVLYIIGMFGDSYYGVAAKIPLIKAVYDIGFIVFSYTRNGILYAPLFLILGAGISKSSRTMNASTCVIGLAISMWLLLAEGFILHAANFPRHDSMYAVLPVCSYFLFCALLQTKKNPAPQLRDISLWIYILHPLCIAILIPFARITGLTGIFINNSMANYLTVCLLSLCAALVFRKVQLLLLRLYSKRK